MATNAGEKAPTESVQAAAMEEEVPTLTEKPASAEVSEPVAVKVPKPAAEVQRPAEQHYPIYGLSSWYDYK